MKNSPIQMAASQHLVDSLNTTLGQAYELGAREAFRLILANLELYGFAEPKKAEISHFLNETLAIITHKPKGKAKTELLIKYRDLLEKTRLELKRCELNQVKEMRLETTIECYTNVISDLEGLTTAPEQE